MLDAERGLIAADLGGGVIKQRIARAWPGRDELLALKKLATELLAYDDRALTRLIATGAFVEVTCDEKTIP